MNNPSATPTKVCSKCGEDKPLGDFSARASACKPCKAAWARQYRGAMTAAELREYRARVTDPEKAKIRNARYRRRHSAEIAEKHRRYYEANKERARERAVAYDAANRKRLRAAAKEWQQANPEKMAEYKRRYFERNPDLRRLLNQNRRARINGARVTKAEIGALPRGDCPECAQSIDYSLEWPDPQSRSLDHIVPLAQGGPHEVGNLQWMHLVCNIRKGSRGEPPAV